MDIEKLGYMLAKVTHLQNLKAMGYTYIATDKDGDTFAYKSKPIKYEEVWESKEGFKIIRIFYFGTSWYDAEPTLIDDLIEKYECEMNQEDVSINTDEGPSIVIKYVVRAGRKDKSKEIEDLKKAAQYLHFEIEYLEGQDNGNSESK